MSAQQAEGWTRRRFLGGLTLAGTAGLLGLHPGSVAAEPLPEVTKLRLIKISGICIAPQYVAKSCCTSRGSPTCSTSKPPAGAGPRGLWPLARPTSASASPPRSSRASMRGTRS
jgi:hypothetical protein